MRSFSEEADPFTHVGHSRIRQDGLRPTAIRFQVEVAAQQKHEFDELRSLILSNYLILLSAQASVLDQFA